MFLVILLGYAVMGSAYYGENLETYSDLLQTVIQLFMLMITYFEYEQLSPYSDLTPLYFVSFMVFFTMFLLNMLVAIIMAHYDEYEQQQVLIKRNQSSSNEGDSSNTFVKLMFILLRNQVAPESQAQSKSKLKRLWFKKWMQLEKRLIKPPSGPKEEAEEIKALRNQLSSKYKQPNYKGEREGVHKYLRPYLLAQEEYNRTAVQDQFRTTDMPLFSEGNGEKQFLNLATLETESETQSKRKQENDRVEEEEKGAEKNDKLMMWIDKNKEAKNYKELQIGVYGNFKNEANCNNDMLTSTAIWLAALEEELFTLSNFKILYTELLDLQDSQFFHKAEDLVKIYQVNEFNSLQASFLAALSTNDHIELWKKANIEQKHQIWQILDFNKLIEDQNRIQSDDTLQDFFDFYSETIQVKTEETFSRVPQPRIEKNEDKNQKSKPILTFKKVNRSPEYQSREYSRASDLQRDLWLEHTNHKERFHLWFNKFNAYYRVKLWNKLQFSEDYALNICNSEQFTRQDIVLFVLEKLDDIRSEYITELMVTYEKLLIRKQKVLNIQCSVMIQKKVLDRVEAIEDKLVKVVQRRMRLQELLKVVPRHIKDKHITPEFYLKIWDLLKQREFEEIIPQTGQSIIDTMRRIKHGNTMTAEELRKQMLKKKSKKEKDTLGGPMQFDLTILDKFDQEESKDLRPKFNVGKDKIQTPNIFSPPPEREEPLMERLGINVDKIIRSQINSVTVSKANSKVPSKNQSRVTSRRQSITERPGSTEPAISLLNERLRNAVATPDSNQYLQPPSSALSANKKFVHFFKPATSQPPEWLGKTIETENRLLTSPLGTDRNEDLERGLNSKRSLSQAVVEPPKLFTQLQISLKAQAVNQRSRYTRRLSKIELHKTQITKLPKLTHMRAMRRLFQLMLQGPDGQLQKSMNKLANEKLQELQSSDRSLVLMPEDDPRRLEKEDKFQKLCKYNFLRQRVSEQEERLALWLPLSAEEKAQMIMAQHIDSEAELMEMLLLEEIDWFGKGVYLLEDLDVQVERGLDTLIYQKYQYLTEKQALETVESNLDRAIASQLEQDQHLLKYLAFLEEKQRVMAQQANIAAKNMRRMRDDNQRIEERIKWNRDFKTKAKRVHFNHSNTMAKYAQYQKEKNTSPWKPKTKF